MDKPSLHAGTSNLSSANIPKKNRQISKTFSQKVKENYQKITFKRCMGTQNDFELEFGSIQVNVLTECLQKHFFSGPF